MDRVNRRIAKTVARKWGYTLKIDDFTWRNPKGLTLKLKPFGDLSCLHVWLNYDVSKCKRQRHDFIVR